MKKRLLALVLSLAVCAGTAAGCSGGPSGSSGTDSKGSPQGSAPTSSGSIDAEGAGNDSFANYDASGTVKIAINKNRSTDFQALIDAFSKVYKNIDLELDYFDTAGGSPEYMTAKASSGDLPDIMFDDYAPMPFYVSQGWVYPLNDFVEGDPDYEEVPQPIAKGYTYNDQLYAVPTSAHFSGIFLNLDILNAMNLKHPSLDWNVDEYAELLKAATNTTYSGTETLFDLDMYLSGTTSKNYTILGYDYDTRKFNMKDSWVQSVQMMRKLREYPGLEAWSLRWNNNADGASDYVKKFGEGDLKDDYMAFKMGKTLSDTLRGTWDAWLYELDYDWEIWPYPQAQGQKGRFPLHVDHSFMTTAVTEENADAAFEVLRYFSYGKEGNLARLSMYDEENEGKYTLNNQYYIPATNQPEVAEKFRNLPNVTEAVVYMYDNMDTSFRADVNKIVPGFDDVNKEYILKSRNQVTDGLADAATVAAEVQDKATSALAKHWNDFDTALAKVQREFKPVHTK